MQIRQPSLVNMKQDVYFNQEPKTLFLLCHDAALIEEMIKKFKLCKLSLTFQLQFPDPS